MGKSYFGVLWARFGKTVNKFLAGVVAERKTELAECIICLLIFYLLCICGVGAVILLLMGDLHELFRVCRSLCFYTDRHRLSKSKLTTFVHSVNPAIRFEFDVY